MKQVIRKGKPEMIKPICFDDCKLYYKVYGGAEKKECIIYNGEVYMLKFRASSENKGDISSPYVNNVYSEYLGSTICNLLGYPAQKTLYGTYRGKEVVACRDFCNDYPEFILYEFNKFKASSLSLGSSGSNDGTELEEILDTINTHRMINDKPLALSKFWDMFVVDAFIGNFDRHNGNWGFLINPKENDSIFAPIFDCGSSLYSRLTDNEMEQILSSEDEIRKRIYDKPTSALKYNGARIKYYDFLAAGAFKECNEALTRLNKKDFSPVFNFISNCGFLSSVRKEFYLTILKARKELLLNRAYRNISKNNTLDQKLDKARNLAGRQEGVRIEKRTLEEIH